MKINKTFIAALFFVLSFVLAGSADASIRAFDNNDLNLGTFSKFRCGTNVTCSEISGQLNVSVTSISAVTSLDVTGNVTIGGSLTGDGGVGDALHGFRLNIISVTADDSPNASECGAVFVNVSIDNILITLPEAAASHGCDYTFVNALDSSSYAINPDDSDRILLVTNAVGDSISSNNAGDSIRILATSADAWTVIAISSLADWVDLN